MDALVEAAELQLAAEMIVALCNNQRLGPQSPQKGYNAVTGSSDSIKVEEDDPTLPNLHQSLCD
ncbi:hypothetical protein FA13DRAFT_1731822 [Coprinellus micaceus]|uniref:Uncharacterized protein n=1 Tax=Coprinellus micaceus TaxID=71717 RepID=A0A4Y7TD27_COPMI|nr:hypothetical protein FA13DRAFT_1731822 [Coprinellus micaceus]